MEPLVLSTVASISSRWEMPNKSRYRLQDKAAAATQAILTPLKQYIASLVYSEMLLMLLGKIICDCHCIYALEKFSDSRCSRKTLQQL